MIACRDEDFLAVIVFSFLVASRVCTAGDAITTSGYLREPEYLTSAGGLYTMGFFSPNGSTNRYVGIWCTGVPTYNVLWVANRENPIRDYSGVIMIGADGNLVIMDGKNQTLWSSSVSASTSNSTARLLDSGNLVLLNTSSSSGGNDGGIIWESFMHPTDSMLPTSKLSSSPRTNNSVVLSSWKSPTDPSVGSFSHGVEPLSIPEVFVWKDKDPFWRSGPWNGKMFIGVPFVESVYHDGFILAGDKEGTVSFTYTNTYNTYSYHLLRPQGEVVQTFWDDKRNVWNIIWTSQLSDCDVYGKCGPFGICDSKMMPICSCLKGFQPKHTDEWSRGNWTSGCIRKSLLECNKTAGDGNKRGKADVFSMLEQVKVPVFAGWSSSTTQEECPKQCLANCSCVAYAYDPGIGCMYWSVDLVDLQKFSAGGTNVFIRLASSELDSRRNLKVIITPAAVVGTVLILMLAYFTKRLVKKHKDREATLAGKKLRQKLGEVNLQELLLFKLEDLERATGNFCESNELGHGGFGPVYKGKLSEGQEIAVKRLSAASGQGLEEFINEMVVISKVQHRNLVRLLGCCVERGEKMLVYEFMQNKSLDVFLFDSSKREQLDWTKRFTIIDGICRGLLYLHRDSRMRIIHRDLKASNILLDEHLNPKISDFGMAKIFGGNENQARTRRVVGTYGYMAPEYAMRGRFSEKSDVYSFGVLLLEIVSGRRNTSYSEQDQSFSLLAIAWKLWKEDNILALVDPMISESSNTIEVLRCVHVGLLCTEELAEDRPRTSTVVSMLNSEIADLPSPKKPAFSEGQIIPAADSVGIVGSSDIIIEGR